MSTLSKNMIVLRSSDGEKFEVEAAVAQESQTIKHMIEDDCADTEIPLPNVTGKILAMVIEYLKRHSQDPKPSDSDLKSFYSEMVKVDRNTLFNLILAANYLDIRSLLDLACQNVADMIRDYSPEQARELFNIQNDFTPEEEEEVRREHAWAFE